MREILIFGIAILLIGCVSQQAAPLDKGIQPPSGLDVNASLGGDNSMVNGSNESMMEENGSGEVMTGPVESDMGNINESGEGRKATVGTTKIEINESEERKESTGIGITGPVVNRSR